MAPHSADGCARANVIGNVAQNCLIDCLVKMLVFVVASIAMMTSCGASDARRQVLSYLSMLTSPNILPPTCPICCYQHPPRSGSCEITVCGWSCKEPCRGV